MISQIAFALLTVISCYALVFALVEINKRMMKRSKKIGGQDEH